MKKQKRFANSIPANPDQSSLQDPAKGGPKNCTSCKCGGKRRRRRWLRPWSPQAHRGRGCCLPPMMVSGTDLQLTLDSSSRCLDSCVMIAIKTFATLCSEGPGMRATACASHTVRDDARESRHLRCRLFRRCPHSRRMLRKTSLASGRAPERFAACPGR